MMNGFDTATSASGVQFLPDSVRTRAFGDEIVIRVKDNVYYYCPEPTGGPDGQPRPISNFVMDVVRIERFVDQPDAPVRRTVRLSNNVGQVIETTANPDELCTRTHFRNFLLSRGDFHFLGTGPQAECLIAMIFGNRAREIRTKHIAGLEVESGVWVFENACIDATGTIHDADRDGVVKVGDTYYRLEKSDTDRSVSRAPRLTLPAGDAPDPALLLKEVMDGTATLWGDQTELAWAWCLSALWRTEWLHVTGNFPLLFNVGPRGIGKNTLTRIQLRLYGLDAAPVSLEGLTDTSVYTNVNRSCNIPVWFDEFKNDIKVSVRESLKGNYDGMDQVRGTLDQFVTKTRRHRTALLVTGESRPSDSALDSRAITPELDPKSDSALLRQTESASKQLSAFTVRLLQRYAELWNPMYCRYCELVDEWKRAGFQSRASENYAKLCATLDVLLPDPSRKERFTAWLSSRVERNQQTNLVVQMVELLPVLMDRRYQIPWLVDRKKQTLHVHAVQLAYRFYNHLKQGERLKSDELIRLAKDAGLLVPGHPDKPWKVRVKEMDEEAGKPVERQQRCFVFDLHNEIVNETAEQLEAKK